MVVPVAQLVRDTSESAPDVVNPTPLLTRPLPDGLYLEFPVFGDIAPLPDDEEVDDEKPLPFVLKVTVNPLSAWDWYCVDASFDFADSGAPQRSRRRTQRRGRSRQRHRRGGRQLPPLLPARPTHTRSARAAIAWTFDFSNARDYMLAAAS